MSAASNNNGNKTTRALPRFPPRCPMCARPSDEQYRPFCSKRCANIDLSRWLSGGYVIPGNSDTDLEDDDLPTPRPPNDEQD